MPENFIEIRRLNKSFGSVAVLRDLDLDVPKGRIVTLLGPSGCGKTTTLRCIAGLERPNSGTILIGGRVVDEAGFHEAPRNRGLGIVFQSFALWPHMSVAENVAFPLRRRGVARGEVPGKVEAVLELVGLGHVAERYPGQLSGGQQQRVALARALVGEPGAILYDEPLSNLDAKLREQMRREIAELHRRMNITAIFVTHDQEEAIDLSDEIHVMRDGIIVQSGSPISIFDRPRDKYVCEFFGQANIFPVASVEAREGPVVRVVTEAGQKISCLPPENVDATVPFVAIRPHRVTLARANGAAAPSQSENVIEGTVRSVRHQGVRSRYQVDIGAENFVDADLVRPGLSFADDERVEVRFAASDCVCLEG